LLNQIDSISAVLLRRCLQLGAGFSPHKAIFTNWQIQPSICIQAPDTTPKTASLLSLQFQPCAAQQA
jgi:hypothetical protein